MKTILFLTIFINGLIQISNAQEFFPANAKPRPADYEYLSAPDSSGNRTLLKSPPEVNGFQAPQILPYPIIFIHGLNSNCVIWNDPTDFMDSQYGTTYGGRIDVCLNFDDNYSSANKNWWPTSGADIALYTSSTNLSVGDYYFLNFDVGLDGSVFPSSLNSNHVKSDQQAIVKQGLAVRQAIYMVLQKTGRDKVVLMGHSMGGLAAREYLQNSSIWQSDGKSHVAKLVTSGTPHGGSNATSFGIISNGTEGQSEAIRDLRTSYYYTGNPGVYLFGGIENLSYMDDQLCCYFYNSDVNCNGTGGTGENITGLNQKSMYPNLDYSCIVGWCTGCPGSSVGDGIVTEYSSILKNFYPTLSQNLFYYYAGAVIEIHTDLPEQTYQNMQGLDEPNDYWISYGVEFNKTYTACNSIQDFNSPYYPIDYDDYVFPITGITDVGIYISNINLSDIGARILNSSYQVVGSTRHSNGYSVLTFTEHLPAGGNYYLEIYGTPSSNSYLFPYRFSINDVTGISELNDEKSISIYPNPSKGIFSIVKADNSVNALHVLITNLLGENILEKNFEGNKMQVDLSNQSDGIYFAKIISDKGSLTKKIILNK